MSNLRKGHVSCQDILESHFACNFGQNGLCRPVDLMVKNHLGSDLYRSSCPISPPSQTLDLLTSTAFGVLGRHQAARRVHRKFQQATSRARDPIGEGHENSLCKCRRRLASVASSFQVKQVKRGCSVNKGLVTNYGGGGGGHQV